MTSVIRTDVLATADRSHVIAFLETIADKTPVYWLPGDHPAKLGQLPRQWPTVNAIPHQQRIEAIAISAPLHCVDGWSYASRAIASLLAGDGHAARHLAYYAQLRAGLSLLANLGVGIFNRINFVAKADGTTERLDSGTGKAGMGTHTAVWEALDAWASSASSAGQFLGMVQIRGSTLSDITSAIWPGSSPQAVAHQFVQTWGMDLKRGKAEHTSRNISSYSPSALNPLTHNAYDCVVFVEDFWRLFEPSGGAGFDNLDKYLLRTALHKNHQIIHGSEVHVADGMIEARYDELPAAVQALTTKDFLLDSSDENAPELLKRANASDSPASADQMISRALLLLRLSLAFTHANLSAAGIVTAGASLRAWLDELAAARGFWRPAQPLDQMGDLWDDVALALSELSSGDAPPACLYDLIINKPTGLPTIAEAERIGLWSLCA